MISATLLKRLATVLCALSLVSAVGLSTGCKEKGPAEKAGADIDKAIGDAKETAKEAAEDAKEAAEKAAEDVKKAADEATKKD